MQKKQNNKWWDGLKTVLLSDQFKKIVEKALISFLSRFITVKGWLLSILIREFSEEAIEIVTDIGDYVVSRKELDDANDNEDRDSAARDVNDWMRES